VFVESIQYEYIVSTVTTTGHREQDGVEVLKYKEIRIMSSYWMEYLTNSSKDKAGASDNAITADYADIAVEIISNTLRQAGDGLAEVECVVEVIFLHAVHSEMYNRP
jgi:hypothetical protein